MKWTTVIFLGVMVLIFSFGLTYLFLSTYTETDSKKVITNSEINGSKLSAQVVKVNYSNIEKELSKNEVIVNLPSEAKILIKFYNFNSGERTWEKSYILSQGAVKEGTLENPDVILSLNSKYLDELTTQNFCAVIKKAKENNDLGIEFSGSETALLWKYKGMLQYKDCFGM